MASLKAFSLKSRRFLASQAILTENNQVTIVLCVAIASFVILFVTTTHIYDRFVILTAALASFN
ncbi:hypothetical protein AOT82_741 [Psychrobacter sp. AntiMn-1]|nr:hypothetical protein AOT82_741 [Psychrobacter sp. AntiMn-1]